MGFNVLAISILDQIATVRSAPVPFLTAILLAAGVTWKYAQREFATRLENAKSKIELAEARLNDCERRLSDSTPDASNKEITALKAQVEAITLRRLPLAQRLALTSTLIGVQGQTTIFLDPNAIELERYAQDFARAIQDAGWHAEVNRSGLNVPDPPKCGIRLYTGGPDDEAAKLSEAFANANLELEVVPPPHSGFSGTIIYLTHPS